MAKKQINKIADSEKKYTNRIIKIEETKYIFLSSDEIGKKKLYIKTFKHIPELRTNLKKIFPSMAKELE